MELGSNLESSIALSPVTKAYDEKEILKKETPLVGSFIRISPCIKKAVVNCLKSNYSKQT